MHSSRRLDNKQRAKVPAQRRRKPTNNSKQRSSNSHRLYDGPRKYVCGQRITYLSCFHSHQMEVNQISVSPCPFQKRSGASFLTATITPISFEPGSPLWTSGNLWDMLNVDRGGFPIVDRSAFAEAAEHAGRSQPHLLGGRQLYSD